MDIQFLSVETPSDIAVSAARTCYFPNGIVPPAKSSHWSRKDKLLEGIFKGGHHTTLQHTHITMMISGVSRHLIWRLLHSHPFYNSEQVSQRYAKMKSDNFIFPKDADSLKWEKYYKDRFDDYEKIGKILLDDVKSVVPKFRQKDVEKKAQEMARYVLPSGISAYLYHTVNIITLLRYIAVSKVIPEAKNEAVEFADIIADKLIELDKHLRPLVEYAQSSKAVFPDLNIAQIKKKHNIKDENVKVYDVVGDADFEVNNNYADVLRFSQMVPDEGVLGGFSTYIKFSLSADAQNQRHRKSPAIRPPLESYYKRSYYIPPIIANNNEALKLYKASIEASYDFFEDQSKKIGFAEAVYALSNAHEIELIERNDFTSFHHKAQMRLCYNAQQEIYDIVYEQVKQLRALNVKGADKFLPPCSIRSNMKIRPICPEGDHFCGVKVWKQDFEDFERKI